MQESEELGVKKLGIMTEEAKVDQALKQFKEDKVDELIKRLKDLEEKRNFFAITELGELGDERTEEPL